MLKGLINIISGKHEPAIRAYADPLLEKVWQQQRVITELTERLEKEKESHRRTRCVYRNVLQAVRAKVVDIDIMVSRAASAYDRMKK